ncbi:ral GTPase-activating protein subunit beta-like protein [Leptotrombidium deliense]|uniref:Ral GTPase-activating protein subunit beta-like protein n=1 Tax=Leptotrombidium deliense TaxID=299467 RepID=A0A443SJT0_9ACAR|nr:ral GTPase-activating protein subunit beta-like protein [Leptotrombidium deliense]
MHKFFVELKYLLESLLSTTNTGVETDIGLQMEYIVIFIHPLKNGLFRVKVSGSVERITCVLPLIDGMIVSQRILGVFVRLTTLNICRRRRFVAESPELIIYNSYQPPHVKRRLKIQVLANKYKQQLNESLFYNNLFW